MFECSSQFIFVFSEPHYKIATNLTVCVANSPLKNMARILKFWSVTINTFYHKFLVNKALHFVYRWIFFKSEFLDILIRVYFSSTWKRIIYTNTHGRKRGNREKEKERHIFLLVVYSWSAHNSQGWCQDPRTLSGSPAWMARSHALEPSFAASKEVLANTWIRSRAARTEIVIQIWNVGITVVN